MQNRMLRAAAAIAAIGFVAACEAPTPTVLNDVAPEVAAPGSDTSTQAPVAKREARQIVVEAGQSLSRIAVKYHTPQRAIIAANNLTPPYKIKIGQQLQIPGAGGSPPAPAVVGSAPPEIIPLDRPGIPGSTAPPLTTATASPAPPPDAPALKPLEVAAPAGDNSPEAPAVTAAATIGSPPASSGSAELPAPATTATTSVPAAPPRGVICPPGTIGAWSDRDIIKLPVYICRKPQSQG